METSMCQGLLVLLHMQHGRTVFAPPSVNNELPLQSAPSPSCGHLQHFSFLRHP